MCTREDARDLINGTDKALSSIKMNVKGWSVSFEPLPTEVSDYKVSVGFAGMRWFPEIDSFCLCIQRLHFGKKKRGRFPTGLEKFAGRFGLTMEEFVPETLTQRM